MGWVFGAGEAQMAVEWGSGHLGKGSPGAWEGPQAQPTVLLLSS